MKAIVVDKFIQDFNELQVADVELPKVVKGHVLVQVRAAGLNFVDLLYSRGLHQNNRKLVVPPFTLGLEFSGVVVSHQLAQATPFKPGTPVYGSHLGSFAQFISVPASSLQVIPPSLVTLASPSFTISPSLSQFVNSAGISSTLPVSYGALVIRGELQKGETVLIHSAAGGLGLMAVQIAKSFNCKVIGTAGSPSKCEIAKKFGADICIDYSQALVTGSSKEWWELVNDVTGGKGVDVVFDPVGLVDKSLKCLKPFARVLIVGFAGLDAERMESIKMNRVLLKQAKLIGYRYGETNRLNTDETAVIWEGCNKLLSSGAIKPTVYERLFYGLRSVPDAMGELEGRTIWGKAVVVVEQDFQGERDLEEKARI